MCTFYIRFYFSILVDRNSGCISIISSTEGGVNIEEVAENNPDDLIKLYISPSEGLNTEVVNKAIKDSKLNQDYNDELNDVISKLYNLFVESDCDLVEVNPLAITNKGVSALDSKVSLDMNAVYRHDNFIDIEKCQISSYFTDFFGSGSRWYTDLINRKTPDPKFDLNPHHRSDVSKPYSRKS